MTRNGFIISIDRNGLGKTNTSLFNKITFEKSFMIFYSIMILLLI
jgi:hypothetical protein